MGQERVFEDPTLGQIATAYDIMAAKYNEAAEETLPETETQTSEVEAED